MISSGYQMKSRCQVHGGRIDEQKKWSGIGIVIWQNLEIASLEYPNVLFAETVLFKVIPEHKFIRLCTLKQTFSLSTRTDVRIAYVLRVSGLVVR
jgi:hypothetical protein